MRASASEKGGVGLFSDCGSHMIAFSVLAATQSMTDGLHLQTVNQSKYAPS